MSVTWSEITCGGTAPAPRSGHSLNVVGQKAYLFGGCGRADGKPQAFNDLYEMDLSVQENPQWVRSNASGEGPCPRSRHTATVIDKKDIVIFGGLDQRVRFNDVYILSTATNTWVKPDVQGTAPSVRAHHSATVVGSNVYILGGYGGNGKAYNDLYILDIANNTWTKPNLKGKGPCPRFDHSAIYFPGKLLVFGGRDTVVFYKDVHVLDLETWTWDEEPGNMPPSYTVDICNQTAVCIESVPNWKLFSYGGKTGPMEYFGDVDVLDCGSLVWSSPQTLGTPPCAREDTAMAYDAKMCRLIMFGGWANCWLGDTWALNVVPIIGPPYACMSIEPHIGPVVGETELTLSGISFRDGNKIEVKFGQGKTEAIVKGVFVSDKVLKCNTPNFEQFGAFEVPIRVSIDGEGWTVNDVRFRYFANTAARFCMAYGPGLLENCVVGVEMPFVIVARDTCNQRRTSGDDKFVITILNEEEVEVGKSRIKDRNDGSYLVHYSVPSPGTYHVRVAYVEPVDHGAMQDIRGSPFMVKCKSSWASSKVTGTLPAQRKGLTFTTMADRMVLYGGDDVGDIALLNITGAEAKWVQQTPPCSRFDAQGQKTTGIKCPPRAFHAASPIGDDMIATFGGYDNAEREDISELIILNKGSEVCYWKWLCPTGYPVPPESNHGHPTMLPTARTGHAMVTCTKRVVVYGGEAGGDMLGDVVYTNYVSETPAWVKLNPVGELPPFFKRRGHAMVSISDEDIYVFGGMSRNSDEEDIYHSDLFKMTIDYAKSEFTVTVLPPVGDVPCARKDMMSRRMAGSYNMIIFGGLDATEKPLNNAYVFDTEAKSWECVYDASPDLVPPMGAVVTMMRQKLISLGMSPGSTRYDQVLTLDVGAVKDSFDFTPRMKEYTVSTLAHMDAQLKGIHAALGADFQEGGFQNLLKVMAGLFDVRSHKDTIELTLDRLAQVLKDQTEEGINVADKEKRLAALQEAWAEIKKSAPVVKAAAQPHQEAEGTKIKERISDFGNKVKGYRGTLISKVMYNFEAGYKKAYADIKASHEEVRALETEAADLKGLSDVFEFPDLMAPVVANVAGVRQDLVVLKDLWDVATLCEMQFHEWQQTPWEAINTDVVEEGAKAFVKEVRNLDKSLRDMDVFKGLDKSVKNFITSIPLVADLRHPSMRQRHWEQLMDTTKVRFEIGADFKLEDLLKLQLHLFEDEVGEIVDRAQKEEKMEQSLAKLQATWSKVEFVFTPFKGADLSLVKLSEEDFEQLEDNQVMVQGMMASRYVATFQDEVTGWNKKLATVADVVQILNEIQRTWSYLESLFIHSDEVKKELPDDATRFAGIDTEVKKILRMVAQKRKVVDVCTQEGLYATLEKQQQLLEVCEKALADYMESKRRLFPRFYFVSTADLLDILSNGNMPTKVMPHMPKCFQAIGSLSLDNPNPAPNVRPKATGMNSCVGKEFVAFSSPLPLEGKVEVYMKSVINKMRSELHDILHAAVQAYNNPKKRHVWLFDWPGQLVLVVSQIFWVQETEAAFASIAKGKKSALADYNQMQIQQLTDLIKTVQGEMKKDDRQKVMNMITYDAHGRDIIQQIVEAKAEKVDCFQWACQLRTYWNAEINDAQIKICDAVFPYGYEYLGNGARLVITPLTDRIYITATQAMWLSMGCAPAGPAGTGKTETTKDLSAQLGKSIYVFNCAPEMDYRTMGDIFKGLAASGSWGCFDEFNRLIPEVLSVCSVQYKAVTDAQKAKKTRFMIAGVEMPLEEGSGAFITMNPGYIGRAELPESLKALFRPITVMVPDRQLIMENMLMAEGFVEANPLAKKFATLYFLLEDLLSPQKHYDWGLRAIKSVLVVAGTLLRAEANQSEYDVLFRALRDFNIPKIVQEDLVIFSGLLADLFPGVSPPRKRDMDFEAVIEETAHELGLHNDPEFILKVVQLSELLAIRHCVFLMGPAGTGRSEAIRTLARSITKSGKKVTMRDINPKSITPQELYGYVNLATREWKDGQLSFTMRELKDMPDENPKWILLDGDLDANWIESMNSVMDDNRLLTLASNERIPLLPHMKMLFEIRDLKYATPATATRAGILYISEGSQWRSMAHSWTHRVVTGFCERIKQKQPDKIIQIFEELFDKYVPGTLFEMRKDFKHITPLVDMNMVTTLVNVLEGCLKPEYLNAKAEQPLYEMYFVFACLWAFGGALSIKDGVDYRRKFDKWWRGAWTTVKIPTKGLVFDYYVNPKTQKFAPWVELVTDIEYNSKTPMSTVFVPTAETASLTFFLDLLVHIRKPIMFVGTSGCGKTQLVKGKLGTLTDDWMSMFINFNYFTDSPSFQKMLEAPLEKKAGKNYGPPGTRKLIYFVDDLNMPMLDPYETAPPISLIRMHMGYGHWFDRQKLTQKDIHNTQYVSCMNPTAGSFAINPRLQRLFATFAMDFPGQDSLMKIYGTFLSGHLSSFSQPAQELATKIIQGALATHDRVATTFRKTAVNFHYEFTVRHLSNVFQGMLMSSPEHYNDPVKLSRLWLHETERVYADRLVSLADLHHYNKIVQDIAKKFFKIDDISEYYKTENAKPLIFCHFANGLAEKVYNEVHEFSRLQKVLEEALAEYNETNAVMDLVLFEDAMKHVCRISRIIMNPGGHALLVGVGGSGKQSLSKLSAAICGYTLFMITISSSYGMSNLRDDIQKMYQKAGLKGEGTAFLFTDSQITDEHFLVYLNDLLSSGDIPDLYSPEDKDNIINAMRGEVKSAGLTDTRENCWAMFISKVRANLHVILTCSPVGEQFRVRAQRFPALVNSTVINWFQPWPEKSLLSVASRFLEDVTLGTVEVRRAVEEFMPFSMKVVEQVSKEFLEVERRYNYTTPKTFLELIKIFRSLLSNKRGETQAAINRLKEGLNKLNKTNKDVALLDEALKVKAKEVEEKVASAEAFAARVGIEKEKVGIENDAANVEAEKCAEIAKDVAIKQASCEKDLAAAEPLVLQAEAALDTLNKKDLGEAKSLKKPPPGVDDVTAAILCLLSPASGVVKDRSWQAAQKEMGQVDKFLQRLKDFKPLIDEMKVPAANFKAVRPYLQLEHFNRDAIINKSKAAAGLCEWTINIVMYYDVVSEVEPKRQELAAANAQLEDANRKLVEVQAKVAELNRQVAELEEQFNSAIRDKDSAIREAEHCQKKLGLAQRLIAALGSEGERWGEGVTQLHAAMEVITGDMLLAAAFVSYIGCFNQRFRKQLMEEQWLPFLRQRQVPMSPAGDPLKVLVDDAVIAGWVGEGLPSDPTSIENGTIVTTTLRWPLLIDPQLQGILWIKERESRNNLQVVRMDHPKTMRVLEAAIAAGHSVLIENMGEKVDAVLAPVISRATFKKGRALYLRMGDKEVEYNKKFRLILHTKLSNPHYPPEIQAETTLVNFTVTEKGLEDQLLALVVNKERPDLEETKTQLILQSNEFTIKLKELEDGLLARLANAEGDITEDVELIESLEESKRVSEDINAQVAVSKDTERQINEAREKYRSAATRGSLLFFLLNSLSKVHSFYQFSLNAFVVVFSRGIDLAPGKKVKPQQPSTPIGPLSPRAPDTPTARFRQAARRCLGKFDWNDDYLHHKVPSHLRGAEFGRTQHDPEDDLTPEELEARLGHLSTTCTFTVFNYARRGLFDKHKLILATMLTNQILLSEGKINPVEYEFLCKMTKSPTPPPMTDELSTWMLESQWAALDAVAQHMPNTFGTLLKAMEKESEKWKNWAQIEQAERSPMPGEWGKLPRFTQLILIRAIRPDRITGALAMFVEEMMGKQYVEQDAFDAVAMMEESGPSTPIFFILFPGYSPSKDIEVMGAKVRRTVENGQLTIISMGQGQEPIAEAVLDKYTKEGGWVFLDNVHLMQGWVPALERKLEIAAEVGHADFRCFFSAEPHPNPMEKVIPESILQTCIKISNEPPSDIKSNLRRAFAQFDQGMFDKSSKPTELKSCLFTLCFFHSVLLGRKKFGYLGWSRLYSFNMGDLTTCADVLNNYLEANEQVPWDDLRYMFGEIFYGGHITDALDRRTCNTYLEVLLGPQILPHGKDAPKFELAPGFKAPMPTNYAEMKAYIEEKLPAEAPIMFGLHSNAELNFLTTLGDTLFTTTVDVASGGGGGKGSNKKEDAVRKALNDILESLPEEFNMVEIESRVKEKTPYRVVALQETVRMNGLIFEIRRSLLELQLGLDGALNMSDGMEAVANGLFLGRVPASWTAVAYPSLKPLQDWYADLLRRITQLSNWTAGTVDLPVSLWLSGLFNAKAFLTAVQQTYARSKQLPLDAMKCMTEITTFTAETVKEHVADGAYVHGLFLEGARWDVKRGHLEESHPKELHPVVPVIHLKPVTADKYDLKGRYQCPTYITSMRGAHFVYTATLKTNHPSHKRGRRQVDPIREAWALRGGHARGPEDVGARLQ
eukprot:jgi/Mesvir1/13247/Mv18980-RA.1